MLKIHFQAGQSNQKTLVMHAANSSDFFYEKK